MSFSPLALRTAQREPGPVRVFLFEMAMPRALDGTAAVHQLRFSAPAWPPLREHSELVRRLAHIAARRSGLHLLTVRTHPDEGRPGTSKLGVTGSSQTGRRTCCPGSAAEDHLGRTWTGSEPAVSPRCRAGQTRHAHRLPASGKRSERDAAEMVSAGAAGLAADRRGGGRGPGPRPVAVGATFTRSPGMARGWWWPERRDVVGDWAADRRPNCWIPINARRPWQGRWRRWRPRRQLPLGHGLLVLAGHPVSLAQEQEGVRGAVGGLVKCQEAEPGRIQARHRLIRIGMVHLFFGRGRSPDVWRELVPVLRVVAA